MGRIIIEKGLVKVNGLQISLSSFGKNYGGFKDAFLCACGLSEEDLKLPNDDFAKEALAVLQGVNNLQANQKPLEDLGAACCSYYQTVDNARPVYGRRGR